MTAAASGGPAGDAKLAELEERLGDPRDPDNPLSYTAVLAADERAELLAAGERALDAYGLAAEFVPAALGGRLVGADQLAHRVRAVFRRDCALGIGHGVTSLIGALPVWSAGSGEQRRRVAELLLGGGRVAAAYTELAHGTDFTRTQLRARQSGTGGQLVLDGRKDLINNVARAEQVLVFARTSQSRGARSHSHLLLEPSRLDPERCVIGQRYRTAGVRGCHLGSISFVDCAVPGTALVGEPGDGLETVLRAFQVTRSVLPGMMVGALDTPLRVATRWAYQRRLYDRRLVDLPYNQQLLASVFLDLLICDSLATVAARALHLLPGQTSVYAAAVKYVVPRLLQEANYELSRLLGARGYLRGGEHGIFQKFTRDLPVVLLAHASSAVCLASIIPQLPRWARRGCAEPAGAPEALFRPGATLPELHPAGLALTAGGADVLTGTLCVLADEFATEPRIGPLCRQLVAELRRLQRICVELPARDTTVLAGRRGFTAAARYALIVAAAACLGVWRYGQPYLDPYLRDPDWLVGALGRVLDRLGHPTGLDPSAAGRVVAELSARCRQDRTFDLLGSTVPG